MALSPEELFLREKHVRLNGTDRSRKGDIDAGIVEMVRLINNHPKYFTTSSCSGRIVVFCESEDQQIQKKGCQWLLVSHDFVEASNVWEAISCQPGSAVLKFEPFVMHIRCCTLREAQKMHTQSLEAGFRNSGLTINKNGKITLAIRSTHILEVPLSDHGNVLVSRDYLEYVVSVANRKFLENQRRVRKLQSVLEPIL